MLSVDTVHSVTINNVIKQFPLLPFPLLSSSSGSSNRFADVRCDARRLATNRFTNDRFHIPMTVGGWCGWSTSDELCNQRDFISKTNMTLISIDFVYGIILSLMYAGHIPVLLLLLLSNMSYSDDAGILCWNWQSNPYWIGCCALVMSYQWLYRFLHCAIIPMMYHSP